ncbi:MAG: recombination regulator RecX [Bacteroidales bacterium]|nr:recombination regulator RecX [Bacteroidales bacterium]MCM1415320.1 recombination regulator RecX [bacterium]MCM1424407.1 recombination regulator RecX [bacterium]
MTVTQMTALTRGRYRVELEDRTTLVLYRGELSKLDIGEGKEIPEETLRRIREEILPLRAKKRVLNLLQRRDYTAARLRDKLKEGGYPEECIEEAVAYAASYGYVDDARYAEDYIRCHLEQKSRMRIEQDLMRKGISKPMIGEAFEKLVAEGAVQDEEGMITALLRKKNFDHRTATMQERQRMYAFLSRRGFHAEAINRALLLDIT